MPLVTIAPGMQMQVDRYGQPCYAEIDPSLTLARVTAAMLQWYPGYTLTLIPGRKRMVVKRSTTSGSPAIHPRT